MLFQTSSCMKIAGPVTFFAIWLWILKSFLNGYITNFIIQIQFWKISSFMSQKSLTGVFGTPCIMYITCKLIPPGVFHLLKNPPLSPLPYHQYSWTMVCTVGENIIATIKMRNNLWYPLKMVIFQYCDGNIGLFLTFVIALSTLR